MNYEQPKVRHHDLVGVVQPYFFFFHNKTPTLAGETQSARLVHAQEDKELTSIFPLVDIDIVPRFDRRRVGRHGG